MKRATHILSVLAFFASIISGQAALKYHVLAITPGLGQGVNDKGDVVGTLSLPSNDIYYQPKRAFLYKNGKITDLGVYNTPQDPYYESTEGHAVNNSDIVVGNIDNIGGPKGGYTPGAHDSFSWKNGVMTDIAQGTSDGGASADAVGVNEQGAAVGSYDAGQYFLHTEYGIPHAYVSLKGVRTDLSTLGGENGNFSFGFAINNAGQVVGVSTNVSYSPDDGGALDYAFLWSNGTMKAIGGAQSSNFAPTAINDNGWIAGTLNVAQVAGTYTGQAVLYVNSRFISLGAVKGFSGSQSLSMNDLGMVVGNLASGVPPYTPSVFVYNGVMHDLNTLVDGGWTITTVGKINIFGQIAATGTKVGSTTTYALLLTPSL